MIFSGSVLNIITKIWHASDEFKLVFLVNNVVYLKKFANVFEIKPTIFVYNEQKVPIKDFNPTMKLGEGSFGVVYRVVV